MKNQIIDIFAGWMLRAPLCWNIIDLIMAVCWITLLILVIIEIKHIQGYRYLVNFICENGEGVSYITLENKIKKEADIIKVQKIIAKRVKQDSIVIKNFQKL